MGFVKRYRDEAQAKALPNYEWLVIVQLNSGEAMVLPWRLSGQRIIYPIELPKTLPTYEEAFELVEQLLTGA